MNKKYFLPLTIVMAGLLVIVALFALKPKPTPKPTDDKPVYVKVAVTPVKKQRMRLSVTSQGTVTPIREINLIAQVTGQIVKVEEAFDNGGFFDASQVLIHIDDSEYQAALLSAKARVAEAKYRLAEELGLSRQAKREWRDLGNSNANDLFMRKPQLAAARANLESAGGALEVAKLNLDRTKITVPFKGEG
ncbi:efflux RND transporter periplasmic adaptor subunit [Teredinibacter haidensis]|uniref:efflux RND transporter periplasmic adaptor subunit n=1 Tax=Teredinibacter haidensis TaxID=2731755 RepID=UPI000948D4EF|nr:hypothetical protein [Teredinibacter haidensis]